MNYLCIDFGGTKTLICVMDSEGSIQTEVRFETPELYPDFVNQLVQEIEQLPDQFTQGVMSVPGLIDHEKEIVVALGNRPWKDFALKQDLLEKTGINMKLLNDARLATLAEAKHLSGIYHRVLYITISTGIGGGLAVDGQLVSALDDTEFGKMPIEIDGTFTPWEEVASGRAIVGKYHKRATDINEPAVWQEIARTFTLGVGPACAAFQPDAIVFGGGVGEQAEKFAHFVKEQLSEVLHPVIRQPKAILASYYQDNAVIYGCYELAKDFAKA